jgi:hypothetical protein
MTAHGKRSIHQKMKPTGKIWLRQLSAGQRVFCSTLMKTRQDRLIIDRSTLEGDEAVLAEINPDPKTITPEYSYEPARAEYDEVPF